MICPKCQDLMRTISRGSVHIDQCENCRGVFLDGGELEQIIAAERAHYAQPAADPTRTAVTPMADELPAEGPPPPYQPPPGTPSGPPPPYQPPPGTAPAPMPPPAYPGGHHDPRHHPHRRRSFLEELLD